VDHWYKAGQQAAQQSAHLEAIGHLRKGLEVLMTLPESAERDRQELTLQTTLGPALMATKGYGTIEAGEVYFRARELCEQGAESRELFTVGWGLFAHHLVRAEYHDARELAEQLLGLAGELAETENFIEAHLAFGVTSMYLGELKATRESLEALVSLYDPERHATLAFRYGGFDPGVMARSYLAATLWLLGHVELAITHADEAQALMRRLDHPYTLARSLYWDAILRQFIGDWQAMRARAEEATAIAVEHGFSLVQAVGPIMLGWSLLGQGHGAEGAQKIRQSLDAYRAGGAAMQLTHFLIPLAEAEQNFGRPNEALEVLADALALVEKTDERYLEAELHRLRGEMLLAQAPSDPGPAERAFEKGLAVARAQGARSLELRAATSLARLWQVEGKTAEARELLAPVYDWFTEGLDTPDLVDAKTLLEELR
jgi:predicted ATPase